MYVDSCSSSLFPHKKMKSSLKPFFPVGVNLKTVSLCVASVIVIKRSKSLLKCIIRLQS